MFTITARYEISKEARIALALAGTPAAQYQVISFEADAAAAVERGLVSVNASGQLVQVYGRGEGYGGKLGEACPLRSGYFSSNHIPWVTDHVLTQEEAVARYEAAWKVTVAEREAERAKNEASRRATQERITRCVDLMRAGLPPDWIFSGWGDDVSPNPDSESVTCAISELPSDLRGAVRDEKMRREKDEKARKAAAEQAVRDKRDAWIASHGSDRLKKGLAAGLIDSMRGIYRDERIAVDLGAGWKVWCDENESDDILNPLEDEINALLEAQRNLSDSDVQLVSASDGTRWHHALKMTCPWDSSFSVICYL